MPLFRNNEFDLEYLPWIRPLHTAEKHRPTMFHTATVRPRRSGPRILYNTPLKRCGDIYSWENLLTQSGRCVFTELTAGFKLFIPICSLKSELLTQGWKLQGRIVLSLTMYSFPLHITCIRWLWSLIQKLFRHRRNPESRIQNEEINKESAFS